MSLSSLFGPSKEAYNNLASQLQAVSSQLNEAQRYNREARENWGAWERRAKEYEAQAEANGRLAASNGKHAEYLQKEIDQLRATLAAFSKVSEGWHNFGGATWFSLDSIVEFTTIEVDIDSSDSNSTKAIILSEINGKSIVSGNLQMRRLDVFLALLDARRKSRRGGGGGGDLPNAPIPGLKPTQPTPGLSR